jgi:hypothetical protein
MTYKERTELIVSHLSDAFGGLSQVASQDLAAALAGQINNNGGWPSSGGGLGTEDDIGPMADRLAHAYEPEESTPEEVDATAKRIASLCRTRTGLPSEVIS